jgi:hypothetical protein
MEIRGKEEKTMPAAIDAVLRISSRTIRLGSFGAASTKIRKSARYQRVGAQGRTPSPAHFARLWAERCWPAGRVVLQLSAAVAMITQHENIALSISGIAMMAEIAQDRSTRSR